MRRPQQERLRDSGSPSGELGGGGLQGAGATTPPSFGKHAKEHDNDEQGGGGRRDNWICGRRESAQQAVDDASLRVGGGGGLRKSVEQGTPRPAQQATAAEAASRPGHRSHPRLPEARSRGAPARSERRESVDPRGAARGKHQARSGAPDADEGRGRQDQSTRAGRIPPPPAVDGLCPTSFCRRREWGGGSWRLCGSGRRGARPSCLSETTRDACQNLRDRKSVV